MYGIGIILKVRRLEGKGDRRQPLPSNSNAVFLYLTTTSVPQVPMIFDEVFLYITTMSVPLVPIGFNAVFLFLMTMLVSRAPHRGPSVFRNPQKHHHVPTPTLKDPHPPERDQKA